MNPANGRTSDYNTRIIQQRLPVQYNKFVYTYNIRMYYMRRRIVHVFVREKQYRLQYRKNPLILENNKIDRSSGRITVGT